MGSYILRRLLLIVPTLFGIMVLNFVIVQAAPGGPVEQIIAQVQGLDIEATARVGGSAGSETGGARKPSSGQGQTGAAQAPTSKYRGAQGLDPEFIAQIEKQFGFDKPAHERFLQMMGNYLQFDFGESFFRDRAVIDLVLDKMPVSISLGLWTTLLVYLISIPLGIAKAVRDGSRFDAASSVVVVIGNAVPSFLFAILLIVLFAGGRYLDWFPLRGLVSEDWETLDWAARIRDYFWHITLPVLSMVIGGFAGLSMLTKNSFWARLPQRHADRHRRLPERLHRHPVHRCAADRDHLLARRPRPARLRGGDQP
jgi:microcin C transport system permease protein